MGTIDRLNRRGFVKKSAAAATALAVAPVLTAGSHGQKEGSPGQKEGTPAKKKGPLAVFPKADNRSVHFFSKQIQFLDYQESAEACAEAGLNGADLTVRPGGHVNPEEVEKDLPRAVKAFRDAGLEILMMVTRITDSEDPLTEKVLRIASEQGLRYYRMGYYSYDPARSTSDNLDQIRGKMEGLAKLNEKYGIHGAYQNHAGERFGAPVWDIREVIRDMDPRWTGCQYDIRHATVEGVNSWPLGMQALKDHIACMVAKDFKWVGDQGKIKQVNVPLGTGAVDLKAFFQLLGEWSIQGPISMHIEYPMFPDENMTKAEKKKRAIELMRTDLESLKTFL